MSINLCSTFLAIIIFVVMLANFMLIFTMPPILPKYLTHVGYYPSNLGKLPFTKAAVYCPCLMKWYSLMAGKYEVDFSAVKRKKTPRIIEDEDEVEYEYDKPHWKYPYVGLLWVVEWDFRAKFLCICVMRTKDEWNEDMAPGQFICPRGNWRHARYTYFGGYNPEKEYNFEYHYLKKYTLQMEILGTKRDNESRFVKIEADHITSNNAYNILEVNETYLINRLNKEKHATVSLKKSNLTINGGHKVQKFIVHYYMPDDDKNTSDEWQQWPPSTPKTHVFQTDTFVLRLDACNTFPVRVCSWFEKYYDFPDKNYYDNDDDYDYNGLGGYSHHLLLTECTGEGKGKVYVMGVLDPTAPLPRNDTNCDTAYLHDCNEKVACYRKGK